SPHQPLKNAPDDFCASAWLFTGVNGGQFRSVSTTKPRNGAFSGGARAYVTRQTRTAAAHPHLMDAGVGVTLRLNLRTRSVQDDMPVRLI
ncbi:hypothetical protein, partial [Enterobacter roggenkampii]|uniref:hypothetical protein n=1 Tax=Enterobacter roggenkampii TaxID=1812935 RepID=UPI00197AAAE5